LDATYINPFVQGAQRIFAAICNESPALGNVSAKPDAYLPVTISVGFFGDFEGEVVFNMEAETGCHIASQMMMGMPVASLDEMAKSALCELGNMICGNVVTIFSGKGITVNINPPSIGANAPPEGCKFASIPLALGGGYVFQMGLAVKA